MRRRLRWWVAGGLCAVGAALALAEPTPPFEAQVRRAEANVRAGSSVSYELLHTLAQGARVQVVGEHAGWYRIRLPQGTRCYVAAQYVDAQGLLTGNRVNVRAGAGRGFTILGQLQRGERVRVFQREGEWAQVEAPATLTGWIRADLLEPVAATAAAPAATTPPPTPASTAEAATPATPTATSDTSGLTATTVAALATATATAQTAPTAVGTLESAHGFRKPGKYRLTSDGRTLYYLRSDAVDLAAHRHESVAVWGTLDAEARATPPLLIVQRLLKRAD